MEILLSVLQCCENKFPETISEQSILVVHTCIKQSEFAFLLCTNLLHKCINNYNKIVLRLDVSKAQTA